MPLVSGAGYLGDFKAGQTVYAMFPSNSAAGARVDPSTAFESADVIIYKNASTTQRTSSAGVTIATTFDTLTGIHHLSVDLSDNTDAGFYAAGNDYFAVLYPDETVDAQSVATVIAQWSIENRHTSKTLAEGYATDGSDATLAQLLYMIHSSLSEFAISGTTVTCKKLDGSTTAMTFTLNSATNPTSRTRAT